MAIEREALELLRQSFDIETEPPLRAQLLRLDEDDHALVIKLHHLITDGWSQRLFWEELAALYGARLNGAASGLPKLAIQYRHFAEWQRAWLGNAGRRGAAELLVCAAQRADGATAANGPASTRNTDRAWRYGIDCSSRGP